MNESVLHYIHLSILLIILFPFSLQSQEKTVPETVSAILQSAENQAVFWLKEKILPNHEIPDPTPLRHGLIQSYQVRPDDPDYPWIYHRSYTYDNALAVIAFTMTGEYQEAELILSALYRNLRPDGSLWFSYNTRDNWPSTEDSAGAVIRSGALAWAGYSAVYYLNERVRDNPRVLKENPSAKKILNMAVRIGEYLLAHQVLDSKDGRNGMVTGGWGEYNLVPGNKRVEDRSYQNDITWVSMEHNIDTYFLFRDLGGLTGETRWIRGAGEVRRGLMSLWSEEYGQFFQGFRPETGVDKALPLDGASWGSLFLHAIAEDEKKIRCLEEMETRFYNEGDTVRGYRPYGDEPVFENRQINTWSSPEAADTLWSDIDIVWGEGSLGAAVAYIRAGMEEKALNILEDTTVLMRNGGFLYASREVPFQFRADPSAASTAWFIIAAEILKKTKISEAFWGRDPGSP